MKQGKPLNGIRVLDLTNVLSGPYCCHQLAHMGAEVIKVEARLRGDLARQLGLDSALNATGMGVSFLAQNAGKKSITLDLKKDAGKALFRRLLNSSDVLVENFRPGVMKRLGLDYETLKDENPELIYCSVSGFGQTGPWVDRPAYDQIIQGISGLMSVTGDGESGPMRAGFPVADTVGGLTAAFAISAALNARPRGAFIDVSMLDALLATMGWAVSNYLVAGVEPKGEGNENPTSAPSGALQTSDGLINIAANKTEQWVLLTDLLGLGELQTHPDFKTRDDRKTNRLELRSRLEAVLKTRTSTHWVDTLNDLGVPAGHVLTVAEALGSDQIKARDFTKVYPDVPGVGRNIELAKVGFKLNGETPAVEDPPPRLGQDNQSIWAELGLTDNEIQELRDQEVI